MRDIDQKMQELGITPKIENSFKPLTDSEIKKLEEDFEVLFPDNYKWLLKRYGAFGFDKWIEFEFLSEVPPYISDLGIGHVSKFFGSETHQDHLTLTLRWNIESYRDMFLQDFIPIAGDSSGDIICMSLVGENFGAIYYWYHEAEEDDKTLYLIAESLRDFLLKLKVNPDL